MEEENTQQPRGRPRLRAGEGKRYTIAIRTTKDLRDRLKSASEASGRSLAREIERRLDRSFDDQDHVAAALNLGIETGSRMSEALEPLLQTMLVVVGYRGAPETGGAIGATELAGKLRSAQTEELARAKSAVVAAALGITQDELDERITTLQGQRLLEDKLLEERQALGVPALRQPPVALALLDDLERRNARVRLLLSEVLEEEGRALAEQVRGAASRLLTWLKSASALEEG
jgi:hypothetical protein